MAKVKEEHILFYLDRTIAAFERTFRYPRYVNMRGQKILIEEFGKRIPIRLDQLKFLIRRAIIKTKEQA